VISKSQRALIKRAFLDLTPFKPEHLNHENFDSHYFADELVDLSKIYWDNEAKLRTTLVADEIDKAGYQRVDFQEALDASPSGRAVLEELGSDPNVQLTGSLAFAAQGTAYRPKGNLLHDLDFRTSYTVRQAKEMMARVFPNAMLTNQFGEKKKATGYTMTYIVPPPGHRIVSVVREGTTKDFGGRLKSYDVVKKESNEVVGHYEKDSAGVETRTGMEATLVDIFVNDKLKRQPPVQREFMDSQGNTRTVNLSRYSTIFEAKLDMFREKDVWDFVNFFPEGAKGDLKKLSPVYLDPNPALKLSSEQRRLVDQANMLSQDIAIGERMIRKPLETMEEVEASISTLRAAEVQLREKLGTEFDVSALAGLRDMAFMRPQKLAEEAILKNNPPAPYSVPYMSELAGFSRTLESDVWQNPNVAYIYSDPDGNPAIEANNIVARTKASTGEVVLRTGELTAERAAQIEAAYAPLTEYTQAMLTQNRIRFRQLALNRRMGGMVDDVGLALIVRLGEEGLVAEDGQTTVDLRKIASEVDRRWGKPWVSGIIDALYAKGDYRERDEGFRDPTDVEREQAIKSMDYLYRYGRQRLSETMSTALSQHVLEVGAPPEYLTKIQSLLNSQSPLVRSVSVQLLERSGTVKSDIGIYGRKVSIAKGATIEKIMQALERVEASFTRLKAEVGRDMAEQSDGWNIFERQAESDRPHTVRTHVHYANTLGLSREVAGHFAGILETELMRVRSSKKLDADDVKSAIVRSIVEGNADLGIISDPTWVDAARAWADNPGSPRPEIRASVRNGLWEKAPADEKIFKQIARRINNSVEGFEGVLDFETGKLHRTPTLVSDGLNRIYSRMRSLVGDDIDLYVLDQPVFSTDERGFETYAHLDQLVTHAGAFGSDRVPLFYLAGDANEVGVFSFSAKSARGKIIEAFKMALGSRYEEWRTSPRWGQMIEALENPEGTVLSEKKRAEARPVRMAGQVPIGDFYSGSSHMDLVKTGRKTSMTAAFTEPPQKGDTLSFHIEAGRPEAYVEVTSVKKVTPKLLEDRLWLSRWRSDEMGDDLPAIGETVVRFKKLKQSAEEILPSQIRDLSESLSQAIFSEGLPDAQFKALLDRRTAGDVLGKIATRAKNERGRDFPIYDYGPETQQFKDYVARGNRADGKLRMLLIDNKVLGDTPPYDGAEWLQSRVLRGLADALGFDHGNTMKAQVFDPDMKFLNKPLYEGSPKTTKLIRDMARRMRLGIDEIDGVIFRASTKIEPPEWADKWVPMAADDMEAVARTITPKNVKNLVEIDVRRLGIKAIDAHIGLYRESYAQEMWLYGGMQHELFQATRGEILSELFGAGGPLARMSQGDLDPWGVVDFMRDTMGNPDLAETDIGESMNRRFQQELLNAGQNPAHVGFLPEMLETMRSRFVDNTLIRTPQKGAYWSHIVYSTGPVEDGQIGVPLAMARDQVRPNTRFAIGNQFFHPSNPEFWKTVLRQNKKISEKEAAGAAKAIARYFHEPEPSESLLSALREIGDVWTTPELARIRAEMTGEGPGFLEQIKRKRLYDTQSAGGVLNLVKEIAGASPWYKKEFRGMVFVGSSMPRVGVDDRRLFYSRSFGTSMRDTQTVMGHRDIRALERDGDGDTMYFHGSLPEHLLRQIDEFAKFGASEEVRQHRTLSEDLGFDSMADYTHAQWDYGSHIGSPSNWMRYLTIAASRGISGDFGRIRIGGAFDDITTQEQFLKRVTQEMRGVADGREYSVAEMMRLAAKAFQDSKKGRVKDYWASGEWEYDLFDAIFPMTVDGKPINWDTIAKKNGKEMRKAAIEARRNFRAALHQTWFHAVRTVRKEPGRTPGERAQPFESYIDAASRIMTADPSGIMLVNIERPKSMPAARPYKTVGEKASDQVHAVDPIPVVLLMARPPQRRIIDGRVELDIYATETERILSEVHNTWRRALDPTLEDLPGLSTLVGDPEVRLMMAQASKAGTPISEKEAAEKVRADLLEMVEAGEVKQSQPGGKAAALGIMRTRKQFMEYRTILDSIVDTPEAKSRTSFHIQFSQRARLISEFGRLFARNRKAQNTTWFWPAGGATMEPPLIGELRNLGAGIRPRREMREVDGKGKAVVTGWYIEAHGLENAILKRQRELVDTFMDPRKWEGYSKTHAAFRDFDRMAYERTGRLSDEGAEALMVEYIRYFMGAPMVKGDNFSVLEPRTFWADGERKAAMLPRHFPDPTIYNNTRAAQAMLKVVRRMKGHWGKDLVGDESQDLVGFTDKNGEYMWVSKRALLRIAPANSPLFAVAMDPRPDLLLRYGDMPVPELDALLHSAASQAGTHPDDIVALRIYNRILAEKTEQIYKPNGIDDRIGESRLQNSHDKDYC